MARQESDREDLLRDATALVERVELTAVEFPEPVVVGFRRRGGGAIYFGADPVVQFNSRNELRRGFRSGRLLKADRGRLVEMTRQHGPTETTLWRRELDPAEEAQLVAEFASWIDRLQRALDGAGWQSVGQVPADVDVLGRVRRWLRELPRPLKIAQRPNAD